MFYLRHDVTYTTPMLDGTRLEQQTTIKRPYRLTYKGAERILRKNLADRGIIVTKIQLVIAFA